MKYTVFFIVFSLVISCNLLVTHSELSSQNISQETLLNLAQEAWEHREFSKCEDYLNHAISQSANPQVYLLFAYLKLQQAQWPKALEYARQARNLAPHLVKTYFFEAADCLIRGEYLVAWQWFDTVRISFPNYVFTNDDLLGLQATLWRILLQLERDNLPKTGLELANQALKYFPNHPLYLSFQAKFLYFLGRIEESENSLQLALAQNPYELQAIQQYRLLLFKQGKYQQAFALWQKIIPQKMLLDPENKIRNLYINLKNSVEQIDFAKVDTLLNLAKDLTKFGWEKEALLVYEKIPGTFSEQQQLQQHLKFLQGIRLIIEQNYRSKNISIIRILDQINVLAKKCQIPLSLQPSQEFDSYFIVVRETNPYDPQPGTLSEYLASYNKMFDLGNNYGYLDCRMMNRISWKLYNREIFGKNVSYNVIVGDETQIDNYIGYHSGSPKVAGRAFLSFQGFYIALDTIRPSLRFLQILYENITKVSSVSKKKSLSVPNQESYIFLQNSNFAENQEINKMLQKNISQNSTEKLGFEYDSNLVANLIRKSLFLTLNNWPDKVSINDVKFWNSLYIAILERQIELVHFHELGHLNDFPCFLPMMTNLGNLVEMLWEQKFSPERIQMRFESIAETFGLTHTSDPYYYLAQIMERMDVNYSGIFELVYWAWYGKMPNQDPYYRASLDILNTIQDLAGCSDTTFFYQIAEIAEKENKSQQNLQNIFRLLQEKTEIKKSCRE